MYMSMFLGRNEASFSPAKNAVPTKRTIDNLRINGNYKCEEGNANYQNWLDCCDAPVKPTAPSLHLRSQDSVQTKVLFVSAGPVWSHLSRNFVRACSGFGSSLVAEHQHTQEERMSTTVFHCTQDRHKKYVEGNGRGPVAPIVQVKPSFARHPGALESIRRSTPETTIQHRWRKTIPLCASVSQRSKAFRSLFPAIFAQEQCCIAVLDVEDAIYGKSVSETKTRQKVRNRYLKQNITTNLISPSIVPYTATRPEYFHCFHFFGGWGWRKKHFTNI